MKIIEFERIPTEVKIYIRENIEAILKLRICLSWPCILTLKIRNGWKERRRRFVVDCSLRIS